MTTFQTSGPIAATIEIGCGDISVTASDRIDVTVTVAARDQAKPADVQAEDSASVEFVNGVLQVRTLKTWRRFTSKNDGSVIVTLEVPTGSALHATTGMGFVQSEGDLADTVAKTGMGDVRLDHVGALTAKTGLGDVTVADITGDAKVTTGTGSIRIGAIEGSATVKNANGMVEIDQCSNDTHIRTSSGDVAIGRALGSVSVGSGAGDVRIAEVCAGSISVRTGGGAIQIGIREGAAAWLELASKYGSVRNGLTEAPGPIDAQSTVEVKARTGVGDITINRAA